MLTITKYKNVNDNDVFCINTDQGSFEIYLNNNLDLCWCYKYMDSSEDIHEFLITKEDCFIYDIFYGLFNAVKNNQSCMNNKKNSTNIGDQYVLFKDNRIEWHSDDLSYDSTDCVIIEEFGDNLKVKFKVGPEGFHDWILVRFSNNGSRYASFYTTFLNMYKMLGQYNFDNHQIRFEEYIYKLKMCNGENHE